MDSLCLYGFASLVKLVASLLHLWHSVCKIFSYSSAFSNDDACKKFRLYTALEARLNAQVLSETMGFSVALSMPFPM